MASYDVAIRTADPDAAGTNPDSIVVEHHLTDRAQLSAETLSGGHLLHLAVAGCLFNDILRAAGQRGITITNLEVRADGGFGGDPTVSSGITYDVTVAGDAPADELRGLVNDCERLAAIPHTLRHGTTVQAGSIRVGG